jgi:hypothetical protein
MCFWCINMEVADNGPGLARCNQLCGVGVGVVVFWLVVLDSTFAVTQVKAVNHSHSHRAGWTQGRQLSLVKWPAGTC